MRAFASPVAPWGPAGPAGPVAPSTPGKPCGSARARLRRHSPSCPVDPAGLGIPGGSRSAVGAVCACLCHQRPTWVHVRSSAARRDRSVRVVGRGRCQVTTSVCGVGGSVVECVAEVEAGSVGAVGSVSPAWSRWSLCAGKPCQFLGIQLRLWVPQSPIGPIEAGRSSRSSYFRLVQSDRWGQWLR